jgi:hypothetical protein
VSTRRVSASRRQPPTAPGSRTGKAMFAFRGAMTIEDGAVLVSGDRS